MLWQLTQTNEEAMIELAPSRSNWIVQPNSSCELPTQTASYYTVIVCVPICTSNSGFNHTEFSVPADCSIYLAQSSDTDYKVTNNCRSSEKKEA